MFRDETPAELSGDRSDGFAEWFDQEFAVAARDPSSRTVTTPLEPGLERVAKPGFDHALDPGTGTEVDGSVASGHTPVRSESLHRRLFRRPLAWAEDDWPTERVVRVIVTALSLIVTTVIMFNVVHLNPLRLVFGGEGDLVFDDTTPTGGDFGAHVWGPAYLRDELLRFVPPQRLDDGLVRRHARLPLLHGACRRLRSWSRRCGAHRTASR